MADLNLIDFYRDAALALLHLKAQFPRRIELYVEDLIGPDHTDEFGLHSKRHEACLGALLWLAEEGYLRYASTVRQEAIDQAVLTSRALILLEAPFDEPGQPGSSLITSGTALRQALDEGSSDALVTVMRRLLSLGRQL